MQIQGIQVGSARKVLIGGRAVLTAIRKTAVAGPVAVQALGLAGDEQADLIAVEDFAFKQRFGNADHRITMAFDQTLGSLITFFD